MDSPGKNTGVDCHSPPGDLPNPAVEPRSPALQADSLPSDPPGSFQMWAGNGAGKEWMMVIFCNGRCFVMDKLFQGPKLFAWFFVTRSSPKVKIKYVSHSWLLVTPWTVTHQEPPWDSLGKNTGVGCLAILQGILSTQGSNPGLLHCRQILYHLSYKEHPTKWHSICI